ncbi:hypothetical protein DFQ27_003934 [Actinomortierella ambigua]|uniref:FAD-binding domain-containing protein n=1 Tax=Actinomortierella ambigua TaxID=1343610 RepID=A0A9P6Q6R8_9FUNG|nr:hypothetical protein DFQ27_003934 [Actinomortierella ambigua]
MHVLIVGAGLGGIMLANLLEKAGISYLIIEKAQKVKPLGSAMSLGSTISPVFKQLGLYDELLAMSYPCRRAYGHGVSSKNEDYQFVKERYGDFVQIVERPKLYELLCRQIPKEKILFGTKVRGFHQNDEGVTLRTVDNMTYHGDVLVGADGAYSVIRQELYKQLQAKDKLPKEDDTIPPYNTCCLVGVTNPMPEDTIIVPEDESRLDSVMYKSSPYFTAFFTQPNRRVFWMVVKQVDDFQTRDEESVKSGEWGPEGAQAMIEEVGELMSPFGKPLSVYIENTAQDGISKVTLEEKLYKTWHSGRTALLGDACHKYFPAAGQGAVSAMLDAVVLANVLEACATSQIEDVQRCLDAYKDERFPAAKLAHKSSYRLGQLLKRTVLGDTFRFMMKFLPRSLIISQFDHMYTLRPQVSFLPFVSASGKIKPAPQRSYDHLRAPASSSVSV